MPATDDLSTTTPNLRRKLIRGAFAAPSLLTVCPGSAFAASSHLRALVNANANPVEATPVIEGQDTFARVQLYVVESVPDAAPSLPSDQTEPADGGDQTKAKKPRKKPKDDAATDDPSEAAAEPEPLLQEAVKRYYVRGRDLGAFKKSGADVPAVGEWLEFDPSTHEKVAGVVPEGAVTSQSSAMTTAGAVTAQPSNKWVTVRFDERGHIVGLGGSGDGAIVTQSALASATAFIVA